jgi:2-dehydropantoate 2-reductase
MSVAVLGAGALGTLFATRLAVNDVPVTLVGRPGPHLDAIRERGIRLQTDTESSTVVDVTVTTEHHDVAGVDWLILAVKSYDTESAMSDVESVLEDVPVLTVQNGLGNAETIAASVEPEQVLVGTTAHGASIPEPGTVRHAGTGKTVIGRYFTPNDDEVEEIADTLTAGGIATQVTDRPKDALWEKVLVNVAINATTALARVPNGNLVQYDQGIELLTRATMEGVAVARAEGRTLPDDMVERASTVARRTATNRSSMRQDLESGSKTEIAALNGEIVARGPDHDIDTPVNRTLTNLVRLAETTRGE